MDKCAAKYNRATHRDKNKMVQANLSLREWWCECPPHDDSSLDKNSWTGVQRLVDRSQTQNHLRKFRFGMNFEKWMIEDGRFGTTKK